MIRIAFKKDFTVYDSEHVQVYINQCHAKGRKTRLFAIRRDDGNGMGSYLGGIEWSGAWRQYVFDPEGNTKWSRGCMMKIIEFLDIINNEERTKWRKQRSS